MSAKRDVETVQAESEAAMGRTLPVEAHGRLRGRAVVQSVRLREDDFAEIQGIAARYDVPVSALIRGWVLAGLADERETTLIGAIGKLVGYAARPRRLAAGSGPA